MELFARIDLGDCRKRKGSKNETNLETISGSSKFTHPNGLNGFFKDFVELV